MTTSMRVTVHQHQPSSRSAVNPHGCAVTDAVKLMSADESLANICRNNALADDRTCALTTASTHSAQVWQLMKGSKVPTQQEASNLTAPTSCHRHGTIDPMMLMPVCVPS